jgi:hypothetical protein
MFSEYVERAMRKAKHELIEDDWDHDDDIPVLGCPSLTPRNARLPKERGTASARRSRRAS